MMNDGLKQIPLGDPVPDTVHAMCSSLPTMDGVIGYEEKRKDVMDKMRLGYPRFVRHIYVQRWIDFISKREGLASDLDIYPVSSLFAAQELIHFCGGKGEYREEDGYYRVSLGKACRGLASALLQHTGWMISSRQAEVLLHESGQLSSIQDEQRIFDAPESIVRGQLQRLCPSAKSIHLARSGMSAAYAAIRAASEIQVKKGKSIWLQLGWLYLDTQRVLEKCLPEGCELVKQNDVSDWEAIDLLFETSGDRVAGIVTEVPTNPLIQTADLSRLSELAQKYGVYRIYDPTLSSLANVDLLPHCDIQVTSLTKYAASDGDVMSGALCIHANALESDELEAKCKAYLAAPYSGDLERLAFEISQWESRIEKVNANVLKLVPWLEQQKAVKAVYWAYRGNSAKHYEALAGPSAPGAMITIELNMKLQSFYDAVPLVKGPSFGTWFTMLCPFMYLAHYDLVSQPEGRKALMKEQIPPDLVRISIGSESLESIKEALCVGFEGNG